MIVKCHKWKKHRLLTLHCIGDNAVQSILRHIKCHQPYRQSAKAENDKNSEFTDSLAGISECDIPRDTYT